MDEPDDPVALFAKLAGISGVPRHPDALRALARHYEARGVRKAAEISARLAAFKMCAEDVINAILSAAAELERKP